MIRFTTSVARHTKRARVPALQWLPRSYSAFPPGLPPEAIIQQTAMAAHQAAALSEVARLRVADIVSESPKSTAELAQQLKLHERSLHRLLIYLQATGYFKKDPATGKWGNTELSAALHSNRLGSSVELMVRQSLPAWLALGAVLADGRPCTARKDPRIYDGEPTFFGWLQKNPSEFETFSASMERYSAAILQNLPQYGYDWGKFRHVVDVGGGKGQLVRSVLEHYPSVESAVVFDLPAVVDAPNGTKDFLREHKLEGKVTAVSGNFFTDAIPEAGPGGALLFKAVIHDWNDADAVKILSNARRSLKGGRIVIVDAVRSDDNPFANWMDLQMMVLLDGKERTREEWAALVEQAGLRLEALTTLKTPDGATAVLEIAEK
eukprot:TRINITY_DN2538_c0_g1_i1.p1 TRINITY_DN2538_c0_g1~~TRINITY_DN2538_c0_g1_i1.p1  ORF type:complete len:378 (-),score=88.05 TRINITY_DN2538_c0_g1_i1:219-1352(-)